MFGLPTVTCLLRMVCLLTCFNFDTPTYYTQKDDKMKAMSVLERMYKEKYRHTHYEKLIKGCAGDNKTGKFGMKDMFTTLRYPMFLGMCIGTF